MPIWVSYKVRQIDGKQRLNLLDCSLFIQVLVCSKIDTYDKGSILATSLDNSVRDYCILVRQASMGLRGSETI